MRSQAFQEIPQHKSPISIFCYYYYSILFLFLLYYPAKASCVVHNAHLIQHEFIVRRDETFTPPALLQSFLSRYACIYSYSLLFSFLPFSNCILHLMHPKLTLQLSGENNNSFVKLRNLDSQGVNVIIEQCVVSYKICHTHLVFR